MPPTLDVELAMHLIGGPLISKRVIGAERMSERELDDLIAMTFAGLAGGVDRR